MSVKVSFLYSTSSCDRGGISVTKSLGLNDVYYVISTAQTSSQKNGYQMRHYPYKACRNYDDVRYV